MSYSRWWNSTWYTYWSSMTGSETQYKWPTKKLKRAQAFDICDFPSYTLFYGELEDDGLALTVSKIRQFYTRPHKGEMFKEWDGNKKPIYQDTVWPAKNPTEDEIRELMGYINKWREDVDRHFKFNTFMLYEWYYPIRNKIIRLWKNKKEY